MDREAIARLLEAVAPEYKDKIAEVFGTNARQVVAFTESERRRFARHPDLLTLAQRTSEDFCSPAFSAKRWLEAAETAVSKLREANTETALAFLLRKGVQTLANSYYNTVPKDWQEFCDVAQSGAYAEFHAPLYGSQLATRVGRSERYAEGRVVGEETVIVNYKFGIVESFERELFDDDQTGQVRDRTKNLGQSMALTESIYAAYRFIGAAATYQNLVIPASNYTSTRTDGAAISSPWDATMHAQGSGSYGNRPSSYVALGLNPLKQAYSELMNAKDPLSNKIIVTPRVLLVSPMDALHAPLLVAPPSGVPYYPALPGATGTKPFSGTTQAAEMPSAGFPGGVFGANPFMGLGIKVAVARWLPAWAWAFGEKKGFLFQEREGLEVVQEAQNAGASFEADAVRFKSRRRFEAEWINGASRFWWLGNDGSVTGSF